MLQCLQPVDISCCQCTDMSLCSFCGANAACHIPDHDCCPALVLPIVAAGETQDEIAARKVQHSWGSWLKQDGSDASEQTGGGCEQQQAHDDEAGCCGHEHHHDADSGKQEQVGLLTACAACQPVPCKLNADTGLPASAAVLTC
jgi:hypothetical protein